MRSWLTLGCVVALVAVAACNRGAEEAPDEQSQQNAPAVNEGAGATDIAQLMHDRHERYEEIGDSNKAIGNALKSDSPSIESIRRHADLIAGYAPQVVSWFPAGSGPETGRRTRAKAEIWTDFDTFRQRARAFEVEAARFQRTVQTGDVEAIRTGHRELGQVCKNCHDRFRGPEIEH
jgi:cytochrome c556